MKIGSDQYRKARLTAAAGLLLLFPLLIWHAGHAGLSSLLSSYAVMTDQIDLANEAVSLGRADPEAHFLRGAILARNEDLSGAVQEYQEAASLRPKDYVLWLDLARARELNGDVGGALEAARQAVPLAPYYAQPHWQLGNILLRAGARDEAFKELGLAGASNSTLFPGIIDLAWRISGGDVEFVERALEPRTPEAYQALAEYFKARGEVAAAIEMFRSAGSAAEQERGRYVAELISAKRFKEAYALWSLDHPTSSTATAGVIIDGGFEQESNLNEPGFGWRADNKAPSLHLFLDTASPREGRSSLSVEFKGESNPGLPVISQLVLVEPRAHYQLRFAARTEGLVSGGLPAVVIDDAGSSDLLGDSGEFPRATNGWRDYTIDFSTADSTTAVQISLRREGCSQSPCPIFGRLWLDSFSLEKAKS